MRGIGLKVVIGALGLGDGYFSSHQIALGDCRKSPVVAFAVNILGFGSSGEGYVRICFAASEATVTAALEKLQHFLTTAVT